MLKFKKLIKIIFSKKQRKKERNYYKTLAEKNNINLSNTNQELITKIQELDDMKIKYQNSLLKLNSLESRVKIF